jgi:hypothetical protein
MSTSETSQKRQGGSINEAAKKFDSKSSGIPSGFNSMIKSPTKAIKRTNKIGLEKIAPTKKYYKDVDIGNNIVGKDSDLEGFGDTLQKVKKEDVEVQPGAMRKHKMIKQLSGKFSKEDLKEEAMERLRKERAEGGTVKPGSSSTLKSSTHSKGSLHGKSSAPRDRPKVNILALVDGAIEEGATDEAKEKAATEKMMAAAPPLPKKKMIKVVRKTPAETPATEVESGDPERAEDQAVDAIPEKTQPEEPSKPRSVRLISKAEDPPKPRSVRLISKAEDPPKPRSARLISKAEDPPKPRSARILGTVDKATDKENTSSAVPSMFGSTAKSTSNGGTPAWKAKLKAQGDRNAESEPAAGGKPPVLSPPSKSTSLGKIEVTSSMRSPTPDGKPPVPSTPSKSISLGKIEVKSSMRSPPPQSPKSPARPSSLKSVQRGSPALASNTPPKASPKPTLHHVEKSPASKRSPIAPPKPPLASAPPPLVGSTPAGAASDDDVSISDAESDTSTVAKPVPSSAPPPGKTFEAPASFGGSKKAVIDDDTEDDDSEDEASTSQKTSWNTRGSVASPSASNQAPKSVSSPPAKTPNVSAMLMNGLSGQSRGDSLQRLRKELEEVTMQVENAGMKAKLELADLRKEFTMEKEALRLPFMKNLQEHKKVTEKQDKEHQKMVDQEQQVIEELRSANQKLRATLDKLPKQMAEVSASNQSLEKANEEIAGHFDELHKFAQKLQTDQDRLNESSAKCKDEFLPRYRQELWERQQFLNAETKIKNLYRDCMIKIANKIDRTSQVDLIEEVATMVVETEGEINPKFDPKLLFGSNKEKDSDGSDNDSDNSDSDSGSDSDSD